MSSRIKSIKLDQNLKTKMDLASKCPRYEMMKKPNKQIKLEFKSTTKLEWNQVKSEFKNNKIWEKLGRNGIIKMF